jgi:hypothetical protein
MTAARISCRSVKPLDHISEGLLVDLRVLLPDAVADRAEGGRRDCQLVHSFTPRGAGRALRPSLAAFVYKVAFMASYSTKIAVSYSVKKDMALIVSYVTI